MSDAALDVLLITGPVGSGKTSVMMEALEILDLVEDSRHAAIEMDALRWCYPRPADDEFATALAFRNLAHVWREYAALGTAKVMISDVVVDASDVEKFAAALPGTSMKIVRIEVSDATLHERLQVREIGSGFDWNVNRGMELSKQMNASRSLYDLHVDNDGKTINEVTREVLAEAGWI